MGQLWAYCIAATGDGRVRELSVLKFRRDSETEHHDGPLGGLRVLAIAGAAACVAVGLAVAAPLLNADRAEVAQLARLTGGEMDAVAFARLTGSMDPAMLSIADRFAPQEMTPAFARVDREAGVMNVLDGGAPEPAVLRLQDMDEAQARAWNASNPTSTLPLSLIHI